MKRVLLIICALFLTGCTPQLGAPQNAGNVVRHLTPEADSTYYLGSTTAKWAQAWFVNATTTGIQTVTGHLTVGSTDDMILNGASLASNVEINSDSQSIIEIDTSSNTAGAGSAIYGARARGTNTAKTVVADGNALFFSSAALGFDGTDYALGGYTLFSVNGTPGANDLPTSYGLYLSSDGTQTPVERIRTSASGTTTLTGGLVVQGNATTTGYLAVGSQSMVNMSTGDFMVSNNATTTNHFEADATLYVKDSKVGILDVTPSVALDVTGAANITTSVTSPIHSSNVADPADAGIVRLGNAETIAWEASPAGTDVTLTVDTSERLVSSNRISAVTGYQIGQTAATAGLFLRGDGTNYVASTLVLPNAATANRVCYASASNTYGESANFTFNGTTVGVTGDVQVSDYVTAVGGVNVGVNADPGTGVIKGGQSGSQWSLTQANVFGDSTVFDTDADGDNAGFLDITDQNNTIYRFNGGIMSTDGRFVQDGCPANFTATNLTCVQTDEEGSAAANTAVEDCYDTYGGRFCSLNELTTAFSNFALTNEDDDDEWVVGAGEILAATCGRFDASASAGTEYDDFDTVACTTSVAYRCCVGFGEGS